MPCVRERFLRLDRECHFRAGGDQDRPRASPPRRFRRARSRRARCQRAARACAAANGRFWRVKSRPSAVACARAPRPRRPPIPTVSHGRQTSMFGIRRRLDSMLDRLVRRAVFAEADRVVREHEDRRAASSAPPCAARCARSRRTSGTCRRYGMKPPCSARPFMIARHAELAHAVVDVVARRPSSRRAAIESLPRW